MKKIILSLLAIAAMTSCTKSSEEEIDPNAPVEIKMQVNIGIAARSAVNDFAHATLTEFGFLRSDGAQNVEVGNLTWGNDLLATTVGGDGTISFSTPQFYDIDDAKYAYFIGIYPKSTLTTASNTFITDQVKDGQQDIMYASMQGGNRKTAKLSSTFDHKLSQLKFKFTKDAALTSLGTVTSIKIKGIKLPKSIDFKTGTITYETSAVAEGITINISNGDYGTDQEASEVIMVQPTAEDLTADITLSDGATYSDIPLKVKTEEGTAHTITLKFQKKSVSSTATITPWTTKDAGETPVE